ncbi:neugrin-like [Asterias rubens]|uniref:neugrin-like n=1 Tax=Asterias rubens TaxID=7604 RepID=UPI0014559AD9|nr:neugrin-like [Asterias rubens]
MFALTVMPKSAVASLLRLSRLDILQQLRGLSLSSSHHIDSFIDKEFEKAETNLDTETLDDPYTLLKKLERDQRRRILAADRARTSRLFKPPTEPRTLSWDTIEQIRYLKQENGEEWTTKKLATSFGISRDLVIKVLKSKFAPTEKTRMKQNEKVNLLAGYLPEKTSRKTKFTGTQRALESSFTKGQQGGKTRITLPASSNHFAPNQNPAEKDTFPPQQRITDEKTVNKSALGAHSRAYSRKAPLQSNPRSKTYSQNVTFEEKNNLTISDKYSLVDTRARGKKSFNGTNKFQLKERTEDELQESEVEEELNIDMEKPETYMYVTEGSGPTTCKIIQRGNEFFDENGEFLYRL